MTWLVERQHPDGTWSPVDRYLTREQARAYARAWSWRENEWFRVRFVKKGRS